jgi:DNA-binding FadR family transcriptional regulator
VNCSAIGIGLALPSQNPKVIVLYAYFARREGEDVTAIRHRGIHSTVVHSIGSRITRGELLPGQVLDLVGLEAEFGVSRTAVREAVRVLGSKGLLDARPKRGTVVTGPEAWSMLDGDVLQWRAESTKETRLFSELAEVRWIVEPAAARLAATKATADDIQALDSALRAMASAATSGSVDEMVDADAAFHRGLLAATHNQLLTSLVDVIEHGLRQRDEIVHTSPGADDPTPSHRAVFQAIVERDADGAEHAVQLLLIQAERDFAQVAQPNPHSDPGGPVEDS